MSAQGGTFSPARTKEPAGGSPARRWLVAAAWVAVLAALFALYLRISLASRVSSDGANAVLQAWDLLHGHLTLPGWQIGDANYYFLELPLIALSEAFFGLGNFAAHLGSALTYLLVSVVALAVAVTDSRGAARVVRCAVVVAVLAAPLLSGLAILALEEPDHMGTSVFILGSFLLIDRVPARRFTAPALVLILTAGQFDDLTVRYIAVPAIVLVCGYRALAARALRSPDAILAGAAIVSVPVSALADWAWQRFGGFSTAPPRGRFSRPALWPHHAAIAWLSLRALYGAHAVPGAWPTFREAAFGYVCLLAAAFGLAWLVWTWRRASRADQMLGVAIVANLGFFVISSFATEVSPHEIAMVLPAGAVLAARALVPARISSRPLAIGAIAATALLAVLPLARAATRPVFTSPQAPLVAWLEAHGLTHGLASWYADGAASTVLSGNRVQLRVLRVGATSLGASHYEVNSEWYNASHNYANFVVVEGNQKQAPAVIERYFGKPARIYPLDGVWIIMVYRKNLFPLL